LLSGALDPAVPDPAVPDPVGNVGGNVDVAEPVGKVGGRSNNELVSVGKAVGELVDDAPETLEEEPDAGEVAAAGPVSVGAGESVADVPWLPSAEVLSEGVAAELALPAGDVAEV
jgi:hypothetical protein